MASITPGSTGGDTPAAQMDLFKERLPNKPYCAEEIGATRIRNIPHALRHRYIQVNPPHLRFWSVFDVDRDVGGILAWNDALLPKPAWAAMNPENGHAHISWGIEAPVLVSDAGRRAPIRYLVGVEAGYRAALRADPGFGGLITKNPTNKHWRVFWGDQMLYSLEELAEYIDIPRFVPRRDKNPEEIGLGRNCIAFDWLRLWAYKNVRGWKRATTHGAFIYWQQECYQRVLTRNGDFAEPMDPRECWHIAKSVSRWVWNRFDIEASDKRFSNLQRARGRSKGKTTRQFGLELLATGKTVREVMDLCGVARRTVMNWRRELNERYASSGEGVQKP